MLLTQQLDAAAKMVDEIFMDDRCWFCMRKSSRIITNDVTGAVVCAACIREMQGMLDKDAQPTGR